LAGLFEKIEKTIYKTLRRRGQQRLIAKFRKLHPFINPTSPLGMNTSFFRPEGLECGILICYE